MQTSAAPGTLRDLRQRTNLGRDVPWFASVPHAEAFVRLALPDGLVLPQKVRYADLGGGDGLLADVMARHLRASGHEVDALVLDGNPVYLEEARARGLAVVQCDLGTVELEGVHLATARLVNHYNSVDDQLRILLNARRSLAQGGWLASQIDCGSDAACRLRTEVANLPSLADAESRGCCWLSVADYTDLQRMAGFRSIRQAGYVVSSWATVEQTLAEAWSRYRGAASELGGADEGACAAFMDQSLRLVARCHATTGDDPQGVVLRNGRYLIRNQHAVTVAQV